MYTWHGNVFRWCDYYGYASTQNRDVIRESRIKTGRGTIGSPIVDIPKVPPPLTFRYVRIFEDIKAWFDTNFEVLKLGALKCFRHPGYFLSSEDRKKSDESNNLFVIVLLCSKVLRGNPKFRLSGRILVIMICWELLGSRPDPEGNTRFHRIRNPRRAASVLLAITFASTRSILTWIAFRAEGWSARPPRGNDSGLGSGEKNLCGLSG